MTPSADLPVQGPRVGRLPGAGPGPAEALAEPRQSGALPASAGLGLAKVEAREGDHFLCRIPGRPPIAALKASGCLLVPGPGDLVLLAEVPPHGAFLLNVLSQAAPGARLELPGDAEIQAPHGTLSLRAAHLELAGGASATLEAPRVQVRGEQGAVAFQSLKATLRTLDVVARTLALTADQVSRVVDRVTERVRHCIRWIDGWEEVRARALRLRVDERYLLQAQRAAILADEEVKVDAKRINLG